ncbi:MAG: TraM recognition domain-containing protein, partial [Minisyncoccia bacterium]
PLIRNIIGQPKSSFDIRTMMDQKKILIMNLSKGLIGETNMRLLGSMLTTRLFLGAMSRADQTSAELSKLPHFYFYVDEFQNFANETFAEILSESRKYKLNLIITNQYIEQMEEPVRDAVFGNVGTTVVFRVGPFDAEVLEPVFMPKFTKEDIVSLGFAQVYMTLMIDGVGSAPFSAVTIPPIEAPAVSHKEAIIASSREQFTAERAGIESSIVEELMASATSEAPADARMKKKPAQYAAEHREQQREPQKEQRTEIRPVQSRPFTPREEHPSPRPTESAPRPFREPQRGPTTPFVPHPLHKAMESTAREQERAPMPRPLPTPAPKSPEDLKAILRTMVTKTDAERGQKISEHQQSLKGALAGVLAKSKQDTPVAVPEKPKPPEVHKPASITEETPHELHAKKPFEISEDQLRKVLKGES